MEDITTLDSKQALPPTAGLHPATTRGREWLDKKRDRGQLPSIPWCNVRSNCTLKPCAGGEGECGWNAIGREWHDVPEQSPEMLLDAKGALVQHLMAFVDPRELSADSELPPHSLQRLRTVGLSEAHIPKDLDANGEELPATLGWTNANVVGTLKDRWFGIPWLGPATDWLECNIAVWEVGQDGLQLYKFMKEVGSFIFEDSAPYIHLLYNSNCGETDFTRVRQWRVRDCTSETMSECTHNHFDKISMDKDFKPFETWTGGSPLQVRPLSTVAGLPPSSIASKGSCEATYAGGKRAGERCENPVKSGCGRFCNVHGKLLNSDRRVLLAKKTSKGGHPPEPSASDGGRGDKGDEGDLGSDGEPTGDLNDYEGAGSKMSTPKERRRAEKIKEEPYRRAYIVVRGMGLACQIDDPEREAGECCFSATGIDLMDQSPDGDFIDGGGKESGSAGDEEAGSGGAGDGGAGSGGASDGEAGDGDAGDGKASDGMTGDGEAFVCAQKEYDIFANAAGVLAADDDGHGYEPDELLRKRDMDPNDFSPSDETVASLPRPRKEDVAMINVDVMGALAFQFFLLMFPEAAVLLLVEETNAYAIYCNQADAPPGRIRRHSQKTYSLGGATWPDDGITYDMVLGVIDIVLTMGLVKLPAFRDHWCTGPFHDFMLVRQCMPREFFFLIYSRFFHMAPSGQPGKGKRGYDSLHCIRALETLLNSTWRSVCKPGRWISFDEQMVRCVTRAAKSMSRHMPKKPIKNGYCFVGYTDGGFSGDPFLRQWMECALGKTCRMVLFVLFVACPELSAHLVDSGTYIACDSYFSSSILFLCLKARGMYAVGTLKSVHGGVQDAKTFWMETGVKLRKKGQMLFTRFGNMAFVQWWDSRVVLFSTTIHLKIGRIDYRRRKAGLVNMLKSWQPWCRRTYNRFMGGVDVSDQYNGVYMIEHRSRNNFWRRVFEQKLYQSLTNSWLLYCCWLVYTTREVDEAIATLEALPDGYEGCLTIEGLNLAELQELRQQLAALSRKKRVDWLRALGTYLMSIGQKGNANKGRRPKKVPAPTPAATVSTNLGRLESFAGSRRAQCQSRKCANRVKGKKASGRRQRVGAPKQESARGANVRTGCRCVDCAAVGGVVMCGECFFDEAKHRSAFEHASSQTNNGSSRVRSTLEFEGDAVARRGGGNKRAKKESS